MRIHHFFDSKTFKIFGGVSSIFVGGKLIKEALEPTLPAEYHGNFELEQEDARKVALGEMSRAEFNRNINSGKYYAPKQVTPTSTYDLWIKRVKKCTEMYPWTNNDSARNNIIWLEEKKRQGAPLTKADIDSLWRYENIEIDD